MRRGMASVAVAIALVGAVLVTSTQVAGAAVPPPAPTAVNAVAGSGRATVSWMPPPSDGGAPITGYVVTPFVGFRPMPARTFASAATTQLITGMTNGWTYRFKVAAVTSAGTGAASLTSNPIVAGTVPAPEPTTFVHPGVLLDRSDLDFVRAQLAAGRKPWSTALQNTMNSYSSESTPLRPTRYRFSSLAYRPYAVPAVQAGASESYLAAHPEVGENVGGQEHLDDSQAAYTHALLWYYTGNKAHATKAIEIMNAWSGTLTVIRFESPARVDNGGPVFGNGKLQAGWGGSLWARAAEIIRYTGGGWAEADVGRFRTMLRNVFLPLTQEGWTNTPNWMMTLAEATIGIGVFNNDRAAFDAGVAMWRDKAPTTIYMATDGALPESPAEQYDSAADMQRYWHYPSSFITGLHGETLRDISHMAFALGAMSNGAQTARIQGINLFQEEQARIVAGYERNAGYVNQYLDQVDALDGAQPPSTWVPTGWPGAAGSFEVGGLGYRGGWEVALGYFQSDGKVSMPNTQRLVTRLRPSQPLFHTTWETLTNAQR